MAEARAENLTVNDWGGGVHPYRIGHRKLGMWLFIMSDSLTFGALLVAYSYARVASVNWPTPFSFYPSIVFSSVMTLEPGDIVSTGTPKGVGFARTPPRYLRAGDDVVIRVAGLGELRNPVIAESATASA